MDVFSCISGPKLHFGPFKGGQEKTDEISPTVHMESIIDYYTLYIVNRVKEQ